MVFITGAMYGSFVLDCNAVVAGQAFCKPVFLSNVDISCSPGLFTLVIFMGLFATVFDGLALYAIYTRSDSPAARSDNVNLY